jgi:hypothetical protein
MMLNLLKVSERVPAGIQDVVFHVYPKGHDHVDDERRSHGDEGSIDKKQTDAGRCYPQLIADSCANPKGLPFHEIFEPIHISNLL